MQQRGLIVVFILCIWFFISFVTNLIGPLLPIVIEDFNLSLGLAGFLPFSFFLAYGLISIPAGLLVERFGPRATLLCAFAVNLLGSLLIAASPGYAVVIGGLFVIGLGMAMLQVVINPLMRTAGGEARFAFFSVLAQLIFGLASFVSPLVFSALMRGGEADAAQGAVWAVLAALAPPDLRWVAFYSLFTLLFVLLLAVTSVVPLPRVDLQDDERAGSRAAYRELLREPRVGLFFLGIVAYVGAEQGLATWMSQFLSAYHGLSPTVEGAHAVAGFWGAMSAGCLVGLVALRLVDVRIVLKLFAGLAIVCIAFALFGSTAVATLAFPAAGFFLSVMFSAIFSLALNSVPSHHGALSGILCSGILGGALLPLAIGVAGDAIGLRAALTLLFVCVGYILSIGFWARPLINNETLSLRPGKSRLARV